MKNLIEKLDLNFYKFDDTNKKFIPIKKCGSFLTKEYVEISMSLLKNNIRFEAQDDSSIIIIED